jgi:hypothetical protein
MAELYIFVPFADYIERIGTGGFRRVCVEGVVEGRNQMSESVDSEVGIGGFSKRVSISAENALHSHMLYISNIYMPV